MVKIILSPSLDVYGQMALDETLVLEKSLAGDNLLRFFNWAGGDYATFGYAQFYADAKKQIESLGIKEFTRRPSGGGIVIHKQDLTFSLVFNGAADFKVREVYRILHSLICRELEVCGAKLEIYNSHSDYRPANNGVNFACFTNPVGDDLMSGGVKVLGGAMRRYGTRVLYQGSLQIENARKNPAYKKAIKKAFADFCGCREVLHEPANKDVLAQAQTLALTYKSKEWKEKF